MANSTVFSFTVSSVATVPPPKAPSLARRSPSARRVSEGYGRSLSWLYRMNKYKQKNELLQLAPALRKNY